MSSKPLLIFCIAFLFLIPLASCGKSVLAGGAVSWKNKEIYDEFIDQATLEDGTIYIGIITAGISLSIARSTANDIANQLKIKYGVQNAEWIPFHPDSGTTCKSDQWNDKLNQMTGLYFNPFTVSIKKKMLKENFSENGSFFVQQFLFLQCKK